MQVSFNTTKQYFSGHITNKNSVQNNNTPEQQPDVTKKIVIPHRTFVNLNQNLITLNSKNSSSNEITRDNFTNLRDKKCLLKKIDDKKNIAIQQGKNLQIAMMDMDNFKSINEILGYEAGDIFIKKISELIRKNASENNLGSYRFGGDEFVIIDISNSPDNLADICQKIKEDVAQDEELSAYRETYKDLLLNRINKYSDKDTTLETINNTKVQIGLLNRIFEKDSALKNNETLHKEYKALFYELQFHTKALLEHSIKQTDNKTELKMLRTALKILNNGTIKEKKAIINSPKLTKYFNKKYNKQTEIKQASKWQNDFNKNGFGITCGIANMQKSFFENLSSEELINVVGEVLKNGKAIEKDNVYIEEFPYEV